MNSRTCVLALLTLAPFAAYAAEQNFTKTISLRDRLDLAIVSGAGNIQISQGPAGRLRITGHVKANDWHATDDRIRDIAASPPIRQSGSIVRIGSTEELTHVIIDYEIEAPADSIVQASADSGDILDDGVGLDARFNTGSGSIRASGLQGAINVSTHEGDIEVEQIGQGEVKAISYTGNLDLRNLHGAVRAATGGGNITISGVPLGDWSVQTERGDIELALGNSPCTIDARAGGGQVRSGLRVEGADTSDLRHLAGNINGGGRRVIVQTGQGQISIR